MSLCVIIQVLTTAHLLILHPFVYTYTTMHSSKYNMQQKRRTRYLLMSYENKEKKQKKEIEENEKHEAIDE